MSTGRLEGKVAVITGGVSGIGFAISSQFAAEGASVVIIDKASDELIADATARIGNGSVGLRTDVTDMSALDNAMAEIRRTHGRIDVLVANAGITPLEPLGSITEANFDLLYNLNVKSTVFFVQKALPLLTVGASVILMSSTLNIRGFDGHTAYSSSKAAVRSFARTWAQELKAREIRVNALSPGGILTPILKVSGFHPETDPERHAQISSMVPMGRLGNPEEIAKAALFLASSDSSYMTGAELSVDGGICQV